MRTVAATEAKQRFGAIIDAAQREPIVIQRQNRDVAVIISPEDYERFRAYKMEEFNRFCDEVGREAQEAGLTEEILEQLLADDSAE
jgi:prevent-host-death family protein